MQKAAHNYLLQLRCKGIDAQARCVVKSLRLRKRRRCELFSFSHGLRLNLLALLIEQVL